jgi:hypothetical protein
MGSSLARLGKRLSHGLQSRSTGKVSSTCSGSSPTVLWPPLIGWLRTPVALLPISDKVYMASLAALQITHFDTVRSRLAELDADVMVAMKPFHAPFNEFHAHTKPKDWPEGLVLAYVGNGFAADFYREVAAFVDADTRALVHQVLADEGHADFVIERVRAAIAADPRLGGRLALWGRRLVGEALSQAQRVAANRDALTSLLTGTVDRPGMDLAAISRMFSRLVENHTRRMTKLGLQA